MTIETAGHRRAGIPRLQAGEDVNGLGTLQGFLAGARVDDAVFALRPDYRAMLVAVDGLIAGPSDEASDSLRCSSSMRSVR